MTPITRILTILLARLRADRSTRQFEIRLIIIMVAGALSAASCGDASNEVDQLEAVQYFFPKYGSSGKAYFLTAEYKSIDDDARQLRGLYRSCTSDDCYVAAWTEEDSYTLQLVEKFCDPPAPQGLGRLVVLLNESTLAQEPRECVPMTMDSIN